MRNVARGIGRGGSASIVFSWAMAVSAAAVEVKVPVPQIHITVPHAPVHTTSPVTPTLKGNAFNSSKGLRQDNSFSTSTGAGATFEESKRRTGGDGITVTKQAGRASPTLEKAVETGAFFQGGQPLNGSPPSNPGSGTNQGAGGNPGVGGIVVTRQTTGTSAPIFQKIEGGTVNPSTQPPNVSQPSNPGVKGIVVTKEGEQASPLLFRQAE